MVLKFKKSKYQKRHKFVSWEIKAGDQPFTEGWEPHTGLSHWWEGAAPGHEASVSGSARAQLSVQEGWTLPKVSKELWWFF